MEEFKSFYKTVASGEGDRCRYPTRLDTYGCGCQHDCKYCYAKSLLLFRKMWNPTQPKSADIKAIRKKIAHIDPNDEATRAIRLGGMTDCFMPIEKERRVTYETIKALNERRIPYLIVTKSSMVADPEYIEVMDKSLAHIQVTVTTFNDDLSASYEKASPPSQRINAIETLEREGFDVTFRLSPYIPDFFDIDKLVYVKCRKVLVEFLRVNTWIRKWFPINYGDYTLESGGYRHLPLGMKASILNKMMEKMPDKVFTVCEDEPIAYKYWKQYVNPNPYDCCNLRM